jgi:hypothetical protein
MTVARSTTSSAAPAPRIHVRAAQASSGDRPSAAHAPGPSALPLASARAHAIATGMPTPTSSSDAPRATAARSAPLACRPCGQAPSRTARKDAMLLTGGLTGGAPTTWHAGLVSLDPAWHQGRAEAHCTGGDRSRSAVADGDGHVIEAACISTLVALRPPLGAWDPRYQISFLALGSRLTPASCSKLVEEGGGGRLDEIMRLIHLLNYEPHNEGMAHSESS